MKRLLYIIALCVLCSGFSGCSNGKYDLKFDITQDPEILDTSDEDMQFEKYLGSLYTDGKLEEKIEKMTEEEFGEFSLNVTKDIRKDILPEPKKYKIIYLNVYDKNNKNTSSLHVMTLQNGDVSSFLDKDDKVVKTFNMGEK